MLDLVKQSIPFTLLFHYVLSVNVTAFNLIEVCQHLSCAFIALNLCIFCFIVFIWVFIVITIGFACSMALLDVGFIWQSVIDTYHFLVPNYLVIHPPVDIPEEWMSEKFPLPQDRIGLPQGWKDYKFFLPQGWICQVLLYVELISAAMLTKTNELPISNCIVYYLAWIVPCCFIQTFCTIICWAVFCTYYFNWSELTG